MATVFHRDGLGSVHGWILGLLSGMGLWLGFGLSLGMATLPLWKLAVRARIWMGMATRRHLDALVFAAGNCASASRLHAAASANQWHKHGCGQSWSEFRYQRWLLRKQVGNPQ